MNIKKRLLAVFLLLILLVLNTFSVFAQNYSFQVTQEVVDVYLESDGTMTIEYIIDFTNQVGADPIDYVDIGTPNDSYNLSSTSAEVNGKSITDIQKSQYVSHGVALGLGANAIPAGKTGRVHARIPHVRDVFYPGTAKEVESYASFQFMPNYFDSKLVVGNTNLTVNFHFPPGITPDEPRYYPPTGWPGQADPQKSLDKNGLILYTWQSTDASGSGEYTFGGSFPARAIPANAIVKTPPFSISSDTLCCGVVFLAFAGFFGLIIYSAIWGTKNRKMAYLPPAISIEGHGIKRGLTAIEASVLMEQPMDKVLTMMLFSTIKKNAATVVSRDPLKIQATDPLPTGLEDYEIKFLQAFQKADEKDRQKDLQDMMIALVKSVSEKMKGFSRKETIDYYKNIIDRAWDYVEQANTPDVKTKKYDEVMDWTMLDHNFDNRTKNVFQGGPVFVPMWWGRFDPGYHPTAGGLTSTPSLGGQGGNITMPTLPGSDFAVSMVNGIQNFSSNVVKDVTGFTSGITDRTNPIPKSSSSGWSSGGGHSSCACACACAGCACACAGGGR